MVRRQAAADADSRAALSVRGRPHGRPPTEPRAAHVASTTRRRSSPARCSSRSASCCSAAAGLLTGGTAGVAFLVHYATGWPFGAGCSSRINLPFYALAWRAFGAAFTLKTFAAIALVSVAAEAIPQLLAIARIEPWFAAVMGGCLIGAGLLMLFRHRASLGGLNVLALHAAGAARLARGPRADGASTSPSSPPPSPSSSRARVALSVLGAVALNLVVAVNHKPGRYLGVS